MQDVTLAMYKNTPKNPQRYNVTCKSTDVTVIIDTRELELYSSKTKDMRLCAIRNNTVQLNFVPT